MSITVRDNSGALFKNRDKAENPKWPDLQGSARIGGQEWWISGWKKTAKDGQTFLSLSFRPKDVKAELAKAKEAADKGPSPIEDSDLF